MREQKQITLTFVGDEETLQRFVEFLSFFHYNGGHSGLFAMPFDGDGADRLRVVDYPIDTEHLRGRWRIGGTGASVEVAEGRGRFSGYMIDWSRKYLYRNGELTRQETLKR